MDRSGTSPAGLFASPSRQGMPPQHLPRMQQHHPDHLQHTQHYQAAIPRQFESQQPFTPGFESMNNIFDRGFHLGANGHVSENDRRANGAADYGTSPAGFVSRPSAVSDRLIGPKGQIYVLLP